jgi:hypothetical protein
MCLLKNLSSQLLKKQSRLIAISREADVKVQVGHVERFNPAFSVCER